MIFLYVIIVILLLVLNGAMANTMKDAVDTKGYDAKFMHIFAWCFWVPFFGYLYAIALPDLKLRAQNEEIIKLLSENSATDAKKPRSANYLPEL